MKVMHCLGKTTTWLSKKADAVLVGFEAAKKRLKGNIIYTGNPTKMQGALNYEETRRKLNITKPLVLVFGGSQGAKKLNETMISLINESKINDYHIVYATGPKNYDEIMAKVRVQNENIKIEKYIYNMEEVMSAADIAVCRSGALTITELGIIGVPSILIPLPTAAENHQYYNAKTIEDVGGGIIIEEKELSKEYLENNIIEILKNEEKLNEMKKRAIRKENIGAIDRIIKEIYKLVNK